MDRALIDRPDEISGSQVHVVYAVPSDGTDRSLDQDGTLANSVGSFQTWLAGQTGGRNLRLDTFGGNLDVSFVRLNRTDAELASHGVYARDRLEEELAELGFNWSNKVYAVYYDGSNRVSCGAGAWPPTLPGRVAALYLRGTPPDSPPCISHEFARSATDQPEYLEFAMLHEILHTLGFVGLSAPHHTLSGHVSDDPRDLMYAGDRPWNPSLLDAGQDDYHGANVPMVVLNLVQSLFLTP